MVVRPSGLLVSVRSPAEAETAILGGATLIDIKEPAAGSLGKADDAAISAIVKQVNGRRPISVALGEFIEDHPLPSLHGISYVKRGLAGCASRDWRKPFAISAGPKTVVVAYADWQECAAPPLEVLSEFACSGSGVLLIDTHRKHAVSGEGRPPHLLDWLTVRQVVHIAETCRKTDTAIALAGSLNRDRIALLRDARPTWFAVRGAACEGAGRDGAVTAARVKELADAVHNVSA